jgi:hypothetical protein
MKSEFDKVLFIPIGLLAVGALLVIFSTGESFGIEKGEMNIKEAAVKANVAEWIADENGKPEFRFKQ